jgi:adenosylmethionine-8-amino-7-oxononanoate aminotransferase
VSDREKKTPFDRSLKVAETVARRTFEKGVIVYPGAGTADGATGDHIILSPPFIIEKGQVDDLVCGVEEALTETAERLPRG